MKAITSRPVSSVTAAERSLRIVCWNERRIWATSSLLLSATRLRSALSMVSCSTTTTTSSRIEVRARVGPRPVYSCTIPTTALEIAAYREPVEARSVSAMAAPLPNPSQRWPHARQREPIRTQRAVRDRVYSSAVLGVGIIEAAAGVPLRALVAVHRDAAGVLEHARHVQQVPGHERGVAVGEVVVDATGVRVEVARPRPGLADPAGVGLRRDRVPEVLERVEDVHRAVLDAVLVTGDQAAGGAAVVGVLAVLVEEVRVAVEPLDRLGADRGLLAQPDRRAEHEDVGGHDLLVDRGPVVALPAVLGHVGPHPGGDVVVDRPHDVDVDPVGLHDADRAGGQALRVRGLGRA